MIVEEFLKSKKGLLVVAILITIISFYSYNEVLGYFFADLDVFPLMKTGRIESFSDIQRIFTEPLEHGIINAYPSDTYYRPISTMSYGMDYAIWHMNPFGYHLTDIILHTLTSIFIFILVRNLWNREKNILALIAALIFCIHPIHVEVVPSISRRSDLIAGMFLISTLISFIKYQKGCKKLNFYISLILCALTLGSKEPGLTVLPLIFLYLFLFSFSGLEIKRRIVESIKHSSPYFVIGAVYLGIHLIICGLKGSGYPSSGYPSEIIKTLNGYFIGLLFPAFQYPVHSIFLKSYIFVQNKILLVIIVGSFLLLLGIAKYKSKFIYFIKEQLGPTTNTEVKVLWFFIGWLIIFACLFTFVRHFSIRYLYHPTIAFSVLLSMVIWFGTKYCKDAITSNILKLPSRRLLKLLAIGFITAVLFCLTFSLASISPFFRHYSEWEEAGEINEFFLEKTADKIVDLPDNSEVFLVNLPGTITCEHLRLRTLGRSTYIIRDYGVQSWMDLKFPAKHIEFYGVSALFHTSYRKDLEMKFNFSNNEVITLEVMKGGFLFITNNKKTNKNLFEFYKDRDRKKLRINIKEKHLNNSPSYILVYLGKNVEILPIRRITRFSVVVQFNCKVFYL